MCEYLSIYLSFCKGEGGGGSSGLLIHFYSCLCICCYTCIIFHSCHFCWILLCLYFLQNDTLDGVEAVIIAVAKCLNLCESIEWMNKEAIYFSIKWLKNAIKLTPNQYCKNAMSKRFGGLYRNHLVHLSIHISCKPNSPLKDEPILLKLYTVVDYDLRMCMKNHNLDPKYFKGDNWTYIV